MFSNRACPQCKSMNTTKHCKNCSWRICYSCKIKANTALIFDTKKSTFFIREGQ